MTTCVSNVRSENPKKGKLSFCEVDQRKKKRDSSFEFPAPPPGGQSRKLVNFGIILTIGFSC